MELRWYWRVLQRQWRIIWLVTLIVALLAAAYTAYSFVGGRYKGQTTLEFQQRPPTYHTQSVLTDALAAAHANATNAAVGAKQYTQGVNYFKSISSCLLSSYQRTLDWKVIRGALGANLSNDTYLDIEYAAASSAMSVQVLECSTTVLQKEFLPDYNHNILAAGSGGVITEYPISLSSFDPPSAINVSLTSTAIGWLEKALAGLVLGAAVAFLWEYLDETIHDEQDVRNWMHTSTLGVIAANGSLKR